MILYAILLKNRLKDENGLPNYIWATKNQIDIITEMRNSPDKRYNFVKINTHIFSPMDIAYIDEKDPEKSGLPVPKYAVERYLQENNQKNDNIAIKELGDGKTLSRKDLLAQEYAF